MPGKNSRIIGDEKLLQKKIPSNKRYNGIEARVDTGKSLTRYMKKIEEMQLNSQSRKDELFKRMKITTLAQLVLQVANIAMQDEEGSEFSPRSDVTNDISVVNEVSPKTSTSSLDDVQSITSSRYSLHSVIRGMGEVDVADELKVKPKPASKSYIEKPYVDCPYLLLDLRDSDDFEACHIITAKSFPVAMLSRTMNCFNREILDYKNSVGKIIILYDEDERLVISAGTTMVERGFDNIFVLSGGLKVLSSKIPEGMVTGSFPTTCRPVVPRSRRNGDDKTKQPRHQADPKKNRFSGDDLDKINHHLSESLIPQDTATRLSRLTRNSNHESKLTNISDISSITSRRAWR